MQSAFQNIDPAEYQQLDDWTQRNRPIIELNLKVNLWNVTNIQPC